MFRKRTSKLPHNLLIWGRISFTWLEYWRGPRTVLVSHVATMSFNESEINVHSFVGFPGLRWGGKKCWSIKSLCVFSSWTYSKTCFPRLPCDSVGSYDWVTMNGMWTGSLCESLPGLAYKNFPFILWHAFFLFWVMGVATRGWPWRPHIQDRRAIISLCSHLTVWRSAASPNLQGLLHFYCVEPLPVCVFYYDSLAHLN